MRRIASLLFLISVSQVANADLRNWQYGEQLSGQISGRAFTNLYMPTEEDWNTDTRALQQSNVLWLDFNSKFNEAHTFRILPELVSMTRTPDREVEETRLKLREGYYQYYKDGIELRLGRQITPWGKSDGINPTDYLTGKDRRRFSSDEEVRRTGADGLSLALTPQQGGSPYTFTAVWNWDFKPSTFLLPLDSIPDIAQVEGTKPVRQNIKNSETAFKISYFQPEWDLAFSFFDGWNRLPQLESDGFSSGILIIVPRFERIQATGLDFSKTYDQVILRAEAAYVSRERKLAKAVTLQSYYDAVLGAERPFGDKYRLQLQVLGRYFPKYESAQSATGGSVAEETANEAVAAANERLQGGQKRWRAGGTARLSYGDADTKWNPEVFTLFYPNTSEIFSRLKIMYRWSTELQTDLGYDNYSGPKASAFGVYKVFNSVFVEARYLF